MQRLKLESEKLKAENRALTRVVSKLTAAGGAGVPPGGVAATGAAAPTTSNGTVTGGGGEMTGLAAGPTPP